MLLNLRDLSGKIGVYIRIQFIVMCYNNYEINGRNLSWNRIYILGALSVELIFFSRFIRIEESNKILFKWFFIQ